MVPQPPVLVRLRTAAADRTGAEAEAILSGACFDQQGACSERLPQLSIQRRPRHRKFE
jgi:hypothetical protein